MNGFARKDGSAWVLKYSWAHPLSSRWTSNLSLVDDLRLKTTSNRSCGYYTVYISCFSVIARPRRAKYIHDNSQQWRKYVTTEKISGPTREYAGISSSYVKRLIVTAVATVVRTRFIPRTWTSRRQRTGKHVTRSSML